MAEYEIKFIPVAELIPYENNPRRNEKAVEAVANSIKEFGFQNPIIVDKDNVIVSGHTRRLAALRLGLEKVPCIVAEGLSDEQIRVFRLADNRLASLSTWDEEKLKEQIKEIKGIDLTLFGFAEEHISEIKKEAEAVRKHVCPRCGFEF